MAFQVREIEEGDLELIMNWRMSPHVTEFMNTDPQLTMAAQKEWYRKLLRDVHSIYWLVEVDGIPAGIIDLRDIDWKQKTASWGYYIGEKSLRSLKLAISLEMSLYDFVFDILKFRQLNNEIFSLNAAVIKLHLACGSVIVREEKDAVEKNGRYFNVTHMSIDASRWQKEKPGKKYEFISFGPSRKVHHIGIAVANVQKSVIDYVKLGYDLEGSPVFDSDRNVRLAFLRNRADNTRIELIEPGAGKNPVAATLAKMGNMATPYHLCYEARNIERAVLEMQCLGYMVISAPAKAVAMVNHRVAFLIKKDTGCVELLEIE